MALLPEGSAAGGGACWAPECPAGPDRPCWLRCAERRYARASLARPTAARQTAAPCAEAQACLPQAAAGLRQWRPGLSCLRTARAAQLKRQQWRAASQPEQQCRLGAGLWTLDQKGRHPAQIDVSLRTPRRHLIAPRQPSAAHGSMSMRHQLSVFRAAAARECRAIVIKARPDLQAVV